MHRKHAPHKPDITMRELQRQQKAAALAERERGRERRQQKTQAAREYILKNPTIPDREVARVTGCSLRAAAYARAQLRIEGLIDAPMKRGRPPMVRTPPEGLPADQDKLETVSAADLMHAVVDEVGIEIDELTPEQSKRILSRIAHDVAQPAQVRIMAVTAKNKLDFETQSRHDLGPGPPLTMAAAAQRLASLIEACGFEVLEAAIALITAKRAPNGEQSPVSGSTGTETAQAPVESEGQSANQPTS